MTGVTYPQLRISYKLFVGDDEGVYINSPANGKISIIADAGGADDITLDGGITIGTGHTFTYSNDGTSASANTSYTSIAATLASGNAIGYIPVTIGTVSGYFLVWSGSAIA